MLCEMPWNFDRIADILTAAARDLSERPRSRHDDDSLDTYSGKHVPGQLWDKYKSKFNEKKLVDLKTKLESILEPSTTKERLDFLRGKLKKYV